MTESPENPGADVPAHRAEADRASLEDYRVALDAYAGPLDLLLYLVRRNEIDLNDIPIARLTDQYLEHLRLIQQIDVDLAGEFLVMASTLLEIKSQMLVPRPESEEGEDNAGADALSDLDPRYELVQQLLAYKRFKEAADALEDRREQWASRFPIKPSKAPKRRPAADSASTTDDELDAQAAPMEIELDDANVLDLCEAFSRILDSIGEDPTHDVTYDDTPIELHVEDVVDRLERDGTMTLQAMFIGRRSRSEMIGLFLAMLELVRRKRVRACQDAATGAIRLELQPEPDVANPDAEAADWRNPETGEIEYDWPSEAERLRAERRKRLRDTWAKRKAEGGDPDDDDLDDELDDADDDEAFDEDELDDDEDELEDDDEFDDDDEFESFEDDEDDELDEDEEDDEQPV